MLGKQEPLGQSQPVLGKLRRHGRQDVRRARLDRIAALVIFAAIKDIGHRLRAALLHDVRDGAARADGRFFLLKHVQSLNQGMRGLVQRSQPPVEEFIFFGSRPLVGWLAGKPGCPGGLHNLVYFHCTELAPIDAYVLNQRAVYALAVMALGDFERHRRANAVLETVGDGSRFLRKAVDIDLHAGRLARAVVGDEQVVPLPQLDRCIGNYLDGVLLPFADDVGPDPIFFDPEIPAAVVVLVVHARQDGAELCSFCQVDPRPIRECLVGVEIAGLRDLDHAARLALVCLGGDMAVVPGDAALGGQRDRLAIELDVNGRPLPFAERRVQA